jgi:hypothetical protein
VWNIERGLNLEEIRAALTGSAELEVVGRGERKPGEKEVVAAQLAALRDVDVLVLNEADLGMKRTGYKDVARELAAYGVEFVEVDPIFELGTEEAHIPDGQQDARLAEDLKVDRQQYRGLHGTAILSRYPIERARSSVAGLLRLARGGGQGRRHASSNARRAIIASSSIFRFCRVSAVTNGSGMAALSCCTADGCLTIDLL